MDPIVALIVAVVILLSLIAANVPVAFALLVSGGVGIVLIDGFSTATATLGSIPLSATSAYSLILIPLYIVLGMFVLHAQVASDLFAIASRVLRRLPGGLGHAAIMACAGFSAVTGSSSATVTTVGRVSINEMRKYGYSPPFAAGIVAAGGTLGILIPPSILLVIYGVLSGESIGGLIIAGIVPGLLSAGVYMVVVSVRASREIKEEYKVDFTGQEIVANRAMPGAAIDGRRAVVSLGSIAVIFIVVIGGMYTGFFTATESGAVGAGVALLILVARTVKGGLKGVRLSIIAAVKEAASTSVMVFMLLVGGGVFAYFIIVGQYATALANWVVDLGIPPFMVIIAFLLIMIPLGMILDGMSMVLILVPIMHPVVSELGFDGIWFAILVVKMVEIGLMTPPVGLNVYIVSAVVKGLTVSGSFKGAMPFVVADLVTVAILFIFPDIVLWLPMMSAGT